MNVEKKQNPILKYWEIVLFIGLTVFNIGYTIARLDNFATKDYVNQKITTAFDNHNRETKDHFIKIDQVPGLNESLQSINEKLDDLKQRLNKLDDKINYNYK